MVCTILFSLMLTLSLFEDVWGRNVPADVKPHIPVEALNPGNVRVQMSTFDLKDLLEVWANLEKRIAGPALETEKTAFKNRRKRSPFSRNFCQWKLCPLAINSPGGNVIPTIETQRPPAVVINQT